jgi:hypothetical protein
MVLYTALGQAFPRVRLTKSTEKSTWKRTWRNEMKFMQTWTLLPGSVRTAAEQFLAGGGGEPEGVKLLGRWHNADCSGGFSLIETDNAAALHLGAAKWADLLELSVVPVIEDAEAGPNLVAVFKK